MKYWCENTLINERNHFMKKQDYPESCKGFLIS